MDPSAEELRAMSNLQDVLTWVGMGEPCLDGLRSQLGHFTLCRQVVLMPSSAWETGIDAVRMAEQPRSSG